MRGESSGMHTGVGGGAPTLGLGIAPHAWVAMVRTCWKLSWAQRQRG